MDGLEQDLASMGFQYIILGMVAAGLLGVFIMAMLARRGRQLPAWMVWVALLGSWFLIQVGFSNQAAVYQYSKRFVLGGAFPSNFSEFWIRVPAAIFRSAIFDIWPTRLAFGIVAATVSMAIFASFASRLHDATSLALKFALTNCIWVAIMLPIFFFLSIALISDQELALKFYVSALSYGLLLGIHWRIANVELSADEAD